MVKTKACRALLCIISVMLVISLSACNAPKADNNGDIRFVDALGREVSVDRGCTRVAALLGSLADIWVTAGGTLCAAAKILKENGASKVYAAVSHCLLSGIGKEKLLNTPEIEQLITTDAVPNIDTLNGKIRVVSVAPLFGEAIRRIHEGKSVSPLFYTGTDQYKK